ncbi:EAL domain-containing protein [Alloalcanivorax sp. C16-1]|uniref:sensor domain-containing phosphodiesterase n=1 Tax=Alloalcanivorax sp. C16-1 TaxID=3390051 RepID=UPI003970F02A
MDNDSLIAPLLAAADKRFGTDGSHHVQDIEHILKTLRTHLGMDVAFIAEFLDGKRVIRHVDSKHSAGRLASGDSHPLEDSYCHYIANGELDGILADTSLHPLTRNMPVTQALDIANYIGVPVHLPDGSLFGTFCCFDHKTGRNLGPRDQALLGAFAEFAGRLIGQSMEREAGDREIRERILNVIRHQRLRTVFQPILHMEERRVVGFEALTRFDTEPCRPPNLWFDEADRVGLGLELQKLAVQTALRTAAPLPKTSYLSLNVSPEQILDGKLADDLRGWPTDRVLLEITEHARISDYPALRQALAPLREQGMDIAVDDAGAGYASFQHVLELEAEIIKLDISLIRDIHRDRARQALAAALIRFGEVIGARVIAEGVESREELATLRRLGVAKVQGYFVGKPMPIEDALRFTAVD